VRIECYDVSTLQGTLTVASRVVFEDGRPVKADYRRYRIVQEAGPGNALGRVKFMFPNGHAIYLHDTPSKGLFSHRTRAYSHGCVRVQNPLKLAEVVLNEPTWDQAAISRVLGTNKTRYVHLDEHLPVILLYLTAEADAAGGLSLRPDIYQRDEALERALQGSASPIRIRFPEPDPPDSRPVPRESPQPETAAPRQAQEGVHPSHARHRPSVALRAEPRPEAGRSLAAPPGQASPLAVAYRPRRPPALP
jgi:hypothetical protein